MEYIISFYVHVRIYVYTFFHNDRIVSIRKTSYLNLESELIYDEEKYTHDIEYIYI